MGEQKTEGEVHRSEGPSVFGSAFQVSKGSNSNPNVKIFGAGNREGVNWGISYLRTLIKLRELETESGNYGPRNGSCQIHPLALLKLV